KSNVLSAALKLKLTEPEPEPVLSVATAVLSAEPSVLASPLGSEAPPDQVTDCTAEPTLCASLRSTSAKASEPPLVSAVLLPVVSAASVMVCGPEASAATTGASLVPVIVMVTGFVELAVPSLTVTS